MANTFLTPTIITRRALELFMNTNAFMMSMDRSAQDEFGRASVRGQKVGSTIGIRLPNDYVTRSGPTAVPQSTNEVKTQLTVAKQIGVDLAFSNVDLTLNITDFSERFLEPAVNNICGGIAADVISGAERIPHAVHNVDASNNTVAPNFGTFARANAILDNNNVPRDRRMVAVDPITMGNSVTSFAGLFNDQERVGNQYRTGLVKDKVIGMNWMMDQTVPKHATAAYGTPPTVNGAGQMGATLVVSATTAPINAGDIFTLPGVYSVNRVTKASNGSLRQFTVDLPAGTVLPAGTTQIPIYPAIVPALTTANAQGNLQQAFQTTTTSPANGASLTFLFNAGETYRKNFVYHPTAMTLAVVPLEVPTTGVVRSHTETQDGISISMVTFFDGINFQEVTRLDVLYGYVWQRPEWACVVGDAL